MSEFKDAFEILIGHEGGHVDHPDDPGGETKFGISKRAYPEINIAGLTVDGAKAIYKKDYWDCVRADELPTPLRFLLFDGAVNAGVAQSIKWLQRAVGVRDDGVIGPVTMVAIKSIGSHKIASNFLGQRLKHMTDLKQWDQFGRGWSRRIASNLMNL